MSGSTTTIDRAALRTNQWAIVSLLVLAFVVGWPPLVVLVALVMGAGAARRRPGFAAAHALLVRAGLRRADPAPGEPGPHAFAQGLGAGVLTAAVAAFAAGWTVAGWALAWTVVALAALNLATGFCAGCAIHYRLARLGAKGFAREAGAGSGGRP